MDYQKEVIIDFANALAPTFNTSKRQKSVATAL